MNDISIFADQLFDLVVSVLDELPPAAVAAALFRASHAIVTGAEIDFDEFSAHLAALTAEVNTEYEQRCLH